MAVDPIFCVKDSYQDGKLVLSEDEKEYHFRNCVSLPKVSSITCRLAGWQCWELFYPCHDAWTHPLQSKVLCWALLTCPARGGWHLGLLRSLCHSQNFKTILKDHEGTGGFIDLRTLVLVLRHKGLPHGQFRAESKGSNITYPDRRVSALELRAEMSDFRPCCGPLRSPPPVSCRSYLCQLLFKEKHWPGQ